MRDRSSDRPAMVLGVGNVLMQDDGLGVRAVERLLDRYQLPPNVRVVDGGVMGLDLLPLVEETDSLILVDAVRLGQHPGTLARLVGPEIRAQFALKTSVHQVGLHELCAACSLRGTLPRRLVLLGLEPEQIALGTTLSHAITESLNALLDAIVRELVGWGFPVRATRGRPEDEKAGMSCV